MVLFIRKIVQLLGCLFYRVKVHGKENLPKDGALIVANHLSMLDPVFILKLYGKKNIFFLAKKEVSTGPASILQKAGAIPVDRENPSMETIMRCIRTLKNGDKLVVFPEGTRNKTGTTAIQTIKEGAGVFAVKAKAPIVPVIISRKAKLFCRTHVYVGKSFELSEFYGVKINDKVTDDMNKVIHDNMLYAQMKVFNENLAKKKKA